MYKIRINPLALQDLIDIKEYITKKLDNPDAAVRIVQKIVGSYEKLKDFPEMGVSLNSKIDIPTDYRFLVSNEYIIFYKLEGEYISVHRVLNVKRDYLRILFKDEGLHT